MLEVELPAQEADAVVEVARVDVVYANMATKANDELSSTASARYSGSAKEVEENVDRETMAAAVMQEAVLVNKRAVELNDAGREDEARDLLLQNGVVLRQQAVQLDMTNLSDYAAENMEDSRNLTGTRWKLRRKVMRDTQYEVDTQQSY